MSPYPPSVGSAHGAMRCAAPEAELAFGVLDAIGDLCALLVSKGVITATELRLVMEAREKINRAQAGNVQAIPAKTLKEVAEIWERAAAPKDSNVIPFTRKEPTR